jgi:hypothetical protein
VNKYVLQLALAVMLGALLLLPAGGSASTAPPPGALEGGSVDLVPGDTDDDGVLDDDDNCPDWANPAQALPSWSLAGNDFDCDGFNADDESRLSTTLMPSAPPRRRKRRGSRLMANGLQRQPVRLCRT